MRSNVTSTAWSSQRQRNGRQGENDEHSLMGHPGRARLPLPLGRGIQGVQVRPAREPHARALARRMARARRSRDGGCRPADRPRRRAVRSEEHTSELQSQSNLVCRLLLEKKKTKKQSKVRPTTTHETDT